MTHQQPSSPADHVPDDPTVDDAAPTVASDESFVADKERGFFSRLYSGTGAFDIIGKRRNWYAVSALILLICILSMIFRGFTLGIDFEGGTQISLPNKAPMTTSSVDEVVTEALDIAPQQVQTAGSGPSSTIQIRMEHLDQQQTARVSEGLAEAFAPAITVNDVSSSDVSSTWGNEITRKMVIALVVFLVVVFIYITIRFDREMSIAAMASLFFDLVVTAGVYSLVGFEVTPAMVIGLLTILGFSVYDTVVVFDKVEENTRGVFATRRRTYAEQTNLAVNQTFMRSINTTIISVLPIIALMVIAVWLLGVGTLKDLALVQLVGVVVGTYSSIYLASPLLVTLKERRKDVAEHTRKVLARRERSAA
ncbi:protein translocase subunit SecF [Gordonia alkaliphila]|uniref:protein translocase subunit SecF n=1 Tax=Gordonia alkaliphila TaxID=1053547 RepID=UPI001FF3BFB4|nr:protein translocase subunit SecF [Gordonia alkaliphila]MCK0440535.1 protein translocase subunit SecF [Gordonia alkaliphila]